MIQRRIFTLFGSQIIFHAFSCFLTKSKFLSYEEWMSFAASFTLAEECDTKSFRTETGRTPID